MTGWKTGLSPAGKSFAWERVLLVPAWFTVLFLATPATGDAQGVCDRTPQVRDKLMAVTGAASCREVTSARLVGVTRLDLSRSLVRDLQAHDFSGMSSLETLFLNNNTLRTLPEGLFRGLTNLRVLGLSANLLSSLPEEVFSDLSNLEDLDFNNNVFRTLPENAFSALGNLKFLSMHGNSLSALSEGVFRGTSGLVHLDLSANLLKLLPEGIFHGLNSLRTLRLENNSLAELPERILSGLDSLESISLGVNPVRVLPEGIFDDVLDTLGADPDLSGIFMHTHQKAAIGFSSTAQTRLEGTTVRVRVLLSHPLSLAVRVPYTVGGSATKDDYANLSPDPSSELLFLAGETTKEITLTLLEDGDGQEETIVLTLGQLSEARLSASDGTGPDAPYLQTEDLLKRPAAIAVHTVSVFDSGGQLDPEEGGVCDRTPQIRNGLMEMSGVSRCADVTAEHLSGVRFLDLAETGITTLQSGDFSGLDGLAHLRLSRNSIGELPPGVFMGLGNLRTLVLEWNSLTSLPEDVFHGLSNLQRLSLWANLLTSLPEGAFSGLSSLTDLRLDFNFVGALPERTFNGLRALAGLNLRSNRLITLPEGIFGRLHSLRDLKLGFNDLSALPPGVFAGLNALENLELRSNRLASLPEEAFSGLSSLHDLKLQYNRLSTLPEGVFTGLKALDSLTLSFNRLVALPRGIFDGLSSLKQLILNNNSLNELPAGVFDDVLDTLGGDLRGTGTLPGRLVVDSYLKATIAFPRTEQRVAGDSGVTIPVALSRELPAAARIPYAVGFSGAAGGLTGLSPLPDRGLLFPAGETRRDIVFTLMKDSDGQGERRVVLSLVDLLDVGLRRSDGRGPDAPFLHAGALLNLPEDESAHTVLVSDSDSTDLAPYCLSLWEGRPCSTAASLPHAFMGPLGESVAKTEVIITHRDPRAAKCNVALFFHQGTSPAAAVSFNGQFPDDNLFRTGVSRGGARILTLAAPDAEVPAIGSVHVFTEHPCNSDSLHVQGRLLLENHADGEVDELFSVAGQSPRDWMSDGDCRTLTGVFEKERSVGLASVTVQPNQSAPAGTRLRFGAFDLKGNFIGGLPSLEISGQHQALSTWEFDGPGKIRLCLDVPGTDSPFRLAVTAIAVTTTGAKAQYGRERSPTDFGPESTGVVP